MGHIRFFFMKLPRACCAVSLHPFPNQYEQPCGVFSTFIRKQSRHGSPHGLTINLSRSHIGHIWVTYESHMGHIWVTYGSHMGHTWSTNVPCNVPCKIIQCCIWLLLKVLKNLHNKNNP